MARNLSRKPKFKDQKARSGSTADTSTAARVAASLGKSTTKNAPHRITEPDGGSAKQGNVGGEADPVLSDELQAEMDMQYGDSSVRLALLRPHRLLPIACVCTCVRCCVT
jgi:hypothetical protein